MLTLTRSTFISCLLLAALSCAVQAGAQDAPAQPCIAVMAAALSGFDGDAAAGGTAVRDLMIKTLSGPMMRPVVVESRVRAQAMQEAVNAGCSQLVTMALTRKAAGSGSSLGRVVGSAAGGAAWQIPVASSAAAAARAAGVGAAQVLTDLSGSTRAKDEIRIEWTLTPLASDGNGAPLTRTDKAKATSNGEDLITPLLQRAAETIVESSMHKGK
jgi:hypothetical protein